MTVNYKHLKIMNQVFKNAMNFKGYIFFAFRF